MRHSALLRQQLLPLNMISWQQMNELWHCDLHWERRKICVVRLFNPYIDRPRPSHPWLYHLQVSWIKSLAVYFRLWEMRAELKCLSETFAHFSVCSWKAFIEKLEGGQQLPAATHSLSSLGWNSMNSFLLLWLVFETAWWNIYVYALFSCSDILFISVRKL